MTLGVRPGREHDATHVQAHGAASIVSSAWLIVPRPARAAMISDG